MKGKLPPFSGIPHLLQLRVVRDALLALHKALIDSERVGYEAVFGRIESPNKFLQLLIQDPWFAWLRAISELIVLMDEALESREPLPPSEALRLHGQVRDLLRASDHGVGFSKQYDDALQRDANVVMAHAEVQRALRAVEGLTSTPPP